MNDFILNSKMKAKSNRRKIINLKMRLISAQFLSKTSTTTALKTTSRNISKTAEKSTELQFYMINGRARLRGNPRLLQLLDVRMSSLKKFQASSKQSYLVKACFVADKLK